MLVRLSALENEGVASIARGWLFGDFAMVRLLRLLFHSSPHLILHVLIDIKGLLAEAKRPRDGLDALVACLKQPRGVLSRAAKQYRKQPGTRPSSKDGCSGMVLFVGCSILIVQLQSFSKSSFIFVKQWVAAGAPSWLSKIPNRSNMARWIEMDRQDSALHVDGRARQDFQTPRVQEGALFTSLAWLKLHLDTTLGGYFTLTPGWFHRPGSHH